MGSVSHRMPHNERSPLSCKWTRQKPNMHLPNHHHQQQQQQHPATGTCNTPACAFGNAAHSDMSITTPEPQWSPPQLPTHNQLLSRTRRGPLCQNQQRQSAWGRLPAAGQYCITQAVCNAPGKHTGYAADAAAAHSCSMLLQSAAAAAKSLEARVQALLPSPSMCVTSRRGRGAVCQSSWVGACAEGQPCTGTAAAMSVVSNSLGGKRVPACVKHAVDVMGIGWF